MGFVQTVIEKGRKIKSRGIALTHKEQGYSANNRYVSLLTKSDIPPEKLNVEVIKALEQVELKISMEEFLRRFFDMWHSDAELLTKALGFTTEFEQRTEDNPADSAWEKEWQEQHQQYIEDKVSSINIIKKAKDGLALDVVEQYELFKTRKAFEQGCSDLGLQFGDTPAIKTVVENTPVQSEKVSTVVKSNTTKTESSAGANTNTIEETPVEQVDVTKSAAFIEMQKAFETQSEIMKSMQADLGFAQEIIKAQKAAKRAVAIEKAAGFTFVAEDQRNAIADVIENPEQATIVAVLEKAAFDLKVAQEALVAKDEEIAEVKKSFADGKEIGKQGELTDIAKGSEDAQTRLDELIKSRTQNLDANKLNA